ncbi:Gfo/Idh/MocA family oxidoreductase [Paenibacillus sp. HB172176]|uniref:Gfo/Idh/MocA family protein n=1 Tax=Paenibacillus sp. HB172176 TaxID=2493690 RepID=UPI001F10D459|nr:Gfo/Idh/MocA family oxidoreductase [Paenibacillus sp. HB172176]
MNFSIIGCQHAHIGIFMKEMLELGHHCAGIYEEENIALAESLANHYQVPMIHDRELLLDESIAVVGCASINIEKIDVIELCEQRGKHVMIDKPVVTNQADFERLKAVAQRASIQIGMLLTERYRASIMTLKQMIDAGELGDIVHIGMRKPHRLTAQNRPQWHFDKKQNGGIAIDLFIHDFDLLRWLTGQEVIAINGYMAKNILPEYPTFYDVASMNVCMGNNIMANLYADWYNPEMSWTWGDCRIFVTGTKGMAEIRLEGDPFVSKEECLLKVTHEQEIKRVVLEQPSATVTEDFLNRIQGHPSFVTMGDIMAATEATLTADRNALIVNKFTS